MEEIMKHMQQDINAKAEVKLKGALQFIANVVLDEMDGFKNVTGNTRNSIAVALYYDGKTKGIATSFDALHHAPTRMALAEGEVYDLNEYWGGDKYYIKKKPFVGKVGEGGYWAQKEAFQFVQNYAPKRRGWSYVVVTATDYAKYLEANKKANILTQFHGEMASMGFDVSQLNG